MTPPVGSAGPPGRVRHNEPTVAAWLAGCMRGSKALNNKITSSSEHTISCLKRRVSQKSEPKLADSYCNDEVMGPTTITERHGTPHGPRTHRNPILQIADYTSPEG